MLGIRFMAEHKLTKITIYFILNYIHKLNREKFKTHGHYCH